MAKFVLDHRSVIYQVSKSFVLTGSLARYSPEPISTRHHKERSAVQSCCEMWYSFQNSDDPPRPRFRTILVRIKKMGLEIFCHL
jgi:hypothetical protein